MGGGEERSYRFIIAFQTILGKTVLRPALLDKRLARELKSLADAEDPYDTVTGKTLCTNDFYEGQGRLDGAFCDYGEAEKMEYLNKLADFGEYLSCACIMGGLLITECPSRCRQH